MVLSLMFLTFKTIYFPSLLRHTVFLSLLWKKNAIMEEKRKGLIEDYWRKHRGSYHKKVKERQQRKTEGLCLEVSIRGFR